MGRKAVVIDLTDRLRNIMETMLSQRQLEKHLHERLLIIIKSAQGMFNKAIAKELGCNARKVGLWRNRWSEGSQADCFTLDENGKELSTKQVIAKIKELLSDAPRSGSPSKITEQIWLRLQALACQSPEDYGLPFSVWTHQELSAQAKRMGIIISPSRYGVLLKKRIKAT